MNSKSYSVTLKAKGSTPITWSKVSGTLPNGIKLAKSTGKLSGTPTKTGTFKFKIRATNNIGYADKTFTIVVGKKPSISTTDLSNGINGKSYSEMLTASGTKTITWSKVSGTFPTGLKLNSTEGEIYGTPS